jgi:hypothetical protein
MDQLQKGITTWEQCGPIRGIDEKTYEPSGDIGEIILGRDSSPNPVRILSLRLHVCSGAPGGNRTPDPQLRRLMLYPTELRAREDLRDAGRRF